MRSKKLGIISLGCDKNRVDTERMLYNLSGKGFVVTPDLSQAQILLINTCAFIESARQEAVENILEGASYKANGLEKLIVTGCLPQKYLSQLQEELPEVDAFLGTEDYDRIYDVISGLYAEDDCCVPAPPAPQEPVQANPCKRILTTPGRYAYLKVSEGCDNYCTYCTIPSIRGRYRSRPMEELAAEARSLVGQQGIREIILVAQDTTRYGTDLYGVSKLPELVRRLTELDLDHVRLMYCYPELVSDALIRELAANPKVAKYIDIPLQHVDDTILKRMNRKGTYQSICSLIAKIKNAHPSIAIRTTFMVGFPGESEQQFERLCRFVEEQPLDHVGIFAYSEEPDTPSARLPDQIDEAVKLQRVDRLGKLFLAKKEGQNAAKIGTCVKAIYQDIDYERGMFVARDEYSAPDIDSLIYFSAGFAEIDQQYTIRITAVDGYDLIGEKI